LVHGRLNYLRNAELILYFFYKNLVFTLPQFYFAFRAAFSGQSFYDDYYITCYNLIFTALPLLMKGIFEYDINYVIDGEDLRDYYPRLYYVGQKSTIFNWSNYFIWVFKGVFHSLIVFILPMYTYRAAILNSDGYNDDQWTLSITSFTAIILVITFSNINFLIDC
jgi:magnesium-transporting ATPase (P-type)